MEFPREAGQVFDLVGLQVAHDAPVDGEVRKLGALGHGFLDLVLAEVADAGRIGGTQDMRRHRLGDRQQAHRLARPSGTRAGLHDPLLHGGEVAAEHGEGIGTEALDVFGGQACRFGGGVHGYPAGVSGRDTLVEFARRYEHADADGDRHGRHHDDDRPQQATQEFQHGTRTRDAPPRSGGIASNSGGSFANGLERPERLAFPGRRKVPHCVRDDKFVGICAVRRSDKQCHPERSEGPLLHLR